MSTIARDILTEGGLSCFNGNIERKGGELMANRINIMVLARMPNGMFAVSNSLCNHNKDLIKVTSEAFEQLKQDVKDGKYDKPTFGTCPECRKLGQKFSYINEGQEICDECVARL